MFILPIQQVKSTILEQLVVTHNVSFKELEAALGVTRWQWNQAQLGIQEIRSGKKLKASHGVKMNVDQETVKKFVDYCLRPDNIQDVAYGSRVVDVDDGTFFYKTPMDSEKSQSKNGTCIQARVL